MPSLDHRPHIWKKVSLIVFRQKFHQNLAWGAYFHFNNHDLFETMIGMKSLNTKQRPARLSPAPVQLSSFKAFMAL